MLAEHETVIQWATDLALFTSIYSLQGRLDFLIFQYKWANSYIELACYAHKQIDNSFLVEDNIYRRNNTLTIYENSVLLQSPFLTLTGCIENLKNVVDHDRQKAATLHCLVMHYTLEAIILFNPTYQSPIFNQPEQNWLVLYVNYYITPFLLRTTY